MNYKISSAFYSKRNTMYLKPTTWDDYGIKTCFIATYVDEDGYTYTYTEIERLNDKIIRGINGASCTDFNTNGRTIIEVEVGLV